MVAVVGILALDVGKVCRRRIQPMSEKLGDENGDRGLRLQERRGVIKLIDLRFYRGAHRRGMRLAQQHGHFAENGAGLGHRGDDGLSFKNIKPAIEQNIEAAGSLAFPDQQRISGKRCLLSSDAMFKNRAHSGLHPDRVQG